MRLTAPPRQNTGRRDTEGMAVASFVLGLVGLVVLNVVLGPVAIVLAVLALRRDTPRRFRAQLGLALGIADLVLLAILVTVNGGVAWTAFG
jgi:threonine/homoserine/homoserine lactone efflux protein